MGGCPESLRPLRFFFLASPTPGHLIPLVDMAKLFSRHGAACTVVTTPGNEPLVRPAIECSSVELLLLPYPPEAAHLIPDGKENFSLIPTSEDHRLQAALFTLKDPLDALLRARRPDCIVSDGIFTWTADTALALGVPRLLFLTVGVFTASIIDTYSTLPAAHDDSVETVAMEGLPHRIELHKSELSSFLLHPELMRAIMESKWKSFGAVSNTFHEIEHGYVELYRSRLGLRRTWCVGPVSMSSGCGIDTAAADRGGRLDPAVKECLRWLDSVEADGSVVYACFGSLNEFGAEQLHGIALGLEASGHPFVWVVRNAPTKEEGGGGANISQCLPEGFEKRTEGRGLVIKGWAPQVVILNHRAVGAFMTHCGWNSTLEGISAGLPMVTWPLSHDQFTNEKFITQVLRVGVSTRRGAELARAVREVMGSGGEEMRRRAREYGVKAKAALEEGGSSYKDIDNLIEEIRKYKVDLSRKSEQTVLS